jgi:exodeoxyribonuclease VII large subunit
MERLPMTRHRLDTSQHVFSVSELNRLSKELLESAFPSIWVEGEISNFSTPSSGHWYFTLKDANAQIRCAMFRNRNVRAGLRPKHGDHVRVRGAISLYAARGDYQLIAEAMEPAGLGALQRAFDELKKRLAAEGLFALERKRELPAMPRHLAIVSSPSGAAVHDILTVLRRRFPPLRISLFPVAVQGDDAPVQIVAAIAAANRFGPGLDPPLDVMIVGRGGGSLEDLWAFNDERVARAIVGSRIPIVSAVGHETDITIADLAADVRAPTPSAAAELASPDRDRLLQLLASRQSRLALCMRRELRSLRERLHWLGRRLRHPGARLAEQSQRLDELELRLSAAMRRRMHEQQAQLTRLASALSAQIPEQRIAAHGGIVVQLNRRLILGMRRRLQAQRERLAAVAQLLNSVSPLATLDRGYAIVTDADGAVLCDAQAVTSGSRIRARLARGILDCTVDASEPEQPANPPS